MQSSPHSKCMQNTHRQFKSASANRSACWIRAAAVSNCDASFFIFHSLLLLYLCTANYCTMAVGRSDLLSLRWLRSGGIASTEIHAHRFAMAAPHAWFPILFFYNRALEKCYFLIFYITFVSNIYPHIKKTPEDRKKREWKFMTSQPEQWAINPVQWPVNTVWWEVNRSDGR